jgi:hypothetical protein
VSGSSTYVVGAHINGDARGLTRAMREALEAYRSLTPGAKAEMQKLADARKILGVLPEKYVQMEIGRTREAYALLAKSGTMSFHEQRMAASAMRQEVTRLTNEMGRMTRMQKLAMTGKVGAAVGAVGIGAAMVIKPKLDVAMDYDTRLRHVINTMADPGATIADKIKGLAAAKLAITNALRYGGGNRDAVLELYNDMGAKGSTFTRELADKLLPDIVRASTATDTAPIETGRIVSAGIQNFKMKPNAEEVRRWLNIAAYGGKVGAFEMRNMAMHLPKLMAVGGQAGMTGKEDFAELVMMMEASEKTAGTPDQAATNIGQFLSDLKSQYFRHRVQKATGLNFTQYAVEQRLNKGQGMAQSALDMIDMALRKHPAYQQVQKELAKPQVSEERTLALESARKMIEGSVIGQMFRNQETTQVVAALLQNKEYIRKGAKEALGSQNTVQGNFDFIAQGPAYQANRAAIESANAMQTMMDKLTPTFGTLMGGVAGVMQQYPGYTGAVITATGALTALSGAAGLAALLMLKTPGATGAGGVLGKALGGATKGGLVGLAGVGGYVVGSLAYKAIEDNAAGNLVGRGVANVASFFGSKEAEEALRREYEFDRANGGNSKALRPVRTLPRAPGRTPTSNAQAPSSDDYTEFFTKPKPAGVLTIAPPIASAPPVGGEYMIGKFRVADGITPAATIKELRESVARGETPEQYRRRVMMSAVPIGGDKAPGEPGAYRGAGFDDPRLLTRFDTPQSMADRLRDGPRAAAQPQDSKTEITVRVVAASGTSAQAEVSKTSGGARVAVQSLGATNVGAGS